MSTRVSIRPEGKNFIIETGGWELAFATLDEALERIRQHYVNTAPSSAKPLTWQQRLGLEEMDLKE